MKVSNGIRIAGVSNRLNRAIAASLFMTASVLAMATAAQANAPATPAFSENISPPATKLVKATGILPSAAWPLYGASLTHTTGLSLATPVSPEIKALAASLLAQRSVAVPADATAFAQNVYDYVRNNIDTEFRYGLSKGGRGALIDQSGTPYDQAELMVMLLRQGGLTANYVVGEVSMNADTFGRWSGLAKFAAGGQTFTVDAKAACQMLADGGIPATVNGSSDCTTVSGDLPASGNSIVMSHIWVQTGGVSYDPAFKAYTLRAGIDLPAAMGCGTQAASTCGSTVRTSVVNNSTLTSFSGIPELSLGTGSSAVYTTLTGLKNNLSNAVKTQNINGQGVNASVFDVLGGRKLDPQGTYATPPSYSVHATWSGSIPDQFRTKLDVKTATCGSFYADEIAGRALLYDMSYTNGNYYSVDNADIATLGYHAAEACSSVASPYYQIYVNHPYLANSGNYADDVVNFKPVDPPSDEVGFYRSMSPRLLYTQDGAGSTHAPINATTDATSYPEQNYLSAHSVTIVHDFGQAGPSAQKHMSDYVAVVGPNNDKCALQTTTKLVYRDCHYEEQAVVAETFASTRTLAGALVDGVNKTITTRHHDIGIIYTGRAQGLSLMTVQETMSIAPQSGSATDRQAAFDSQSLIQAEAEARANAIDGAEGISAAQRSFGGDYYDVAPAQMASFLSHTTTQYHCIKYIDQNAATLHPDGCWRQLALQDIANQGYSALIREGSLGELLYRDPSSDVSERGLTLWEYVKGAATIGDALTTARKSTEVVDEAALRRKFLSVSPSSGDLAFQASPDIVTGTGDFPASLPFVRTFTPAYHEKLRGTSTYYYNGPGMAAAWSSATVSAGPDSQYQDRLGGGWMHNFQVMQFRSNDQTYALGAENAYLASEIIADLQVIRDLGETTNDLPTKVGSLLAIDSISRTTPADAFGIYDFNTVMTRTGTSSVTFHRNYDGTWFSPANPSAKFAYTTNGGGGVSGSTYTSANSDIITFSPYRYGSIAMDPVTLQPYNDPATFWPAAGEYVNLFKADSWAFPNGTRVAFTYTGIPLTSGCDGPPQTDGISSWCAALTGEYGYQLTSVSNNLGHALNFTYTKQGVRHQTTTATTFGYELTGISDETGRHVTFSDGGTFDGNDFTVTNPLGYVTHYEYDAQSDSPNPATIVRNDYQLRRWFSAGDTTHAYQTIKYDDLFRVARITDRNSHGQLYFPSGMFSSERWKRTETIDGVSTQIVDGLAPGPINRSLNLFDDKSGNFYSRSPIGRVTTKTFDNLSRPLMTISPEGNGTENSYDARGNLKHVRTFSKSLGRCGPATTLCSDDINTSTTYVQNDDNLVCANNVTCNKPATETDGRGNVTNYAWNATTGDLTQVLKPADVTAKRPQTDLAYTTLNGITFLTSKTDYISNAATLKTVATTYGYDSTNHYVLKTETTDPSGLNLTTTLGFDAIGNLTSLDGPRTDVTDVTTYEWDAGRRIRATISPDPDAGGSLLRKATRYTYNADDWVTRTDNGTTNATDVVNTPANLTVVTSEIPTYDAMGDKIQSVVTKP